MATVNQINKKIESTNNKIAKAREGIQALRAQKRALVQERKEARAAEREAAKAKKASAKKKAPAKKAAKKKALKVKK